MEIKELKDLIETATEQLTADYACYFSIRDAEIIIELAKKEIKQKPVFDHRYQDYGCEFCGNQVGGWEENPDYCPQCGHGIDWSVEENEN